MLISTKTKKIPLHTGLSDKAFLLRVIDKSMEPEFHEGETFVLDPTQYAFPQDRQFVVARLSDGSHVLRRYIVKRGKAFDLQAENGDFTTLSSTSERPIEIIGIVVEHHRRHFA